MWWKLRLFLKLFSIQLQWTWSEAFKPQKQHKIIKNIVYMTHELISSHLKLYDSVVWGKDSNEFRREVHERTFWIFSMNHLIRFIKPMILLNWTDLVLQFNSLIHLFTAVRNKTLLVENNFILNLFLTQSYRSCLWTTLIVLLCVYFYLKTSL